MLSSTIRPARDLLVDEARAACRSDGRAPRRARGTRRPADRRRRTPRGVEEEVVAPVVLARARRAASSPRPSGSRRGASRAGACRTSVLPTPDGPETHDEEARGARSATAPRRAHSTFCTCSRSFSISSLSSITTSAMIDVVALGADRVDLAVHLLQQEVELAPRRLGVGEQPAELVEVRRAAARTPRCSRGARRGTRPPARRAPGPPRRRPSSGLSRASMRSCASFGRSGARSSARASSVSIACSRVSNSCCERIALALLHLRHVLDDGLEHDA